MRKSILSKFAKAKHGETIKLPHRDNAGNNYYFNLENPTKTLISDKSVLVKGWLIRAGKNVHVDMRIKNNQKHYVLPYGIKRPDIEKKYKDYDNEGTALNCGFEAAIPYEDGELVVQANFGHGYIDLNKVEVEYNPELLVDDYYVSGLEKNTAEHRNLLENKKKYYFEEGNTNSFIRSKDDPKIIAFYLPQFYPIPENDHAWGKGFTEWRNVASAKPRFIGHRQPLQPTELGYYDLRLEQTMSQQIKLAQQHGIYGFCFYYYWFSGKKLLDAPIANFLKNDWDFNFMICWANENWTKRWDGNDSEVIVAQKYLKSDPLDFIKEVEHILLDSRYIRRNNKPLLAVYRGTELKGASRYVETWRNYFKKKNGLDLEIVTVHNFDLSDPRPSGFDGGIEFAPFTDINNNKSDFEDRNTTLEIDKSNMLENQLHGWVIDYRYFALRKGKEFGADWPTYKSLTPSWDNDARKKGNNTLIIHNANPDLYGHWLNNTIESSKLQAPSDNLIFINAWNEWAEGAVLEPTGDYGRAVLNRTSEVLARHSSEKANKLKFPLYGFKKTSKAKTAVIVHVFYHKEWQYIQRKIKQCLDLSRVDVYVSLSEKNAVLAQSIRKEIPNSNVIVVPNRGRDVLPFLFLARRCRDLGYNYVLKIHTKRSKHRTDGGEWFEELVESLLPNKKICSNIPDILEEKPGIVGPRNHIVSLEKYIGGNRNRLNELIDTLKFQNDLAVKGKKAAFIAGSMFWANMSQLDPLLDLWLIPEDFESEQGQIDGTLAHAVERLVSVINLNLGGSLYQMSQEGISSVKSEDILDRYNFAE